MSTGLLPRTRPRPPGGRPRSRVPEHGERGSARARRSAGRAPGSPAQSRARSAPAPRCTRSRAATCRCLRREWRAARCARRCSADQTSSGTRVGEPAGADVVDRQDRVRRAKLPAAVDDFLRAALHLGVAALHRVEVQVGSVLAPGAHRGGRAAAHADEHAGAAELDQQRAGAEGDFAACSAQDAAQAAGQHDRLVVAAHRAARARLEAAEIAARLGRPNSLLNEAAPIGRLEHDVERRDDALGLARIVAAPRAAAAPGMRRFDTE